MRPSLALAALLLPLTALAAAPAKPAPKADKVKRAERGALVIENIPEIPPALAEVALERLNAGGNGWLGKKQRFGRAAKAALICYVHEGFKLTEIHE